jgi:hypothetical protein
MKIFWHHSASNENLKRGHSVFCAPMKNVLQILFDCSLSWRKFKVYFGDGFGSLKCTQTDLLSVSLERAYRTLIWLSLTILVRQMLSSLMSLYFGGGCVSLDLLMMTACTSERLNCDGRFEP